MQEMGPVVLPNFCHPKVGAFGTFRSKSTFSFVSLKKKNHILEGLYQSGAFFKRVVN